jgi:mRNA interferase RelE/StbE
VSEWRLSVATSTERTLSRLPERIAAAVVEFMVGPLVETPTVVGKPHQRELEGYWSARRGAYRVIYHLDEDEGLVVVVRIEHRGDVFRSR